MLNKEKEDRAIQYLKSFEPKTEPYYLCYSGGKDSDTIRILADLAGVSYECHNNHTTVDAPETVYYIREVMSKYGEMRIEHDQKDGHKIYRYGERGFIHLPLKTMWDLIVDNGIPPTRIIRYCCRELKEKGGQGRRKITGVRWAESTNRANSAGLVRILGDDKKLSRIAEDNGADYTQKRKGGIVLNTDNDESRRVVEQCYRTMSAMVNPIVDWTDSDVWDFLRHYGCESNPLYKKGLYRIGCIGCPMLDKHKKENLQMFPKYKKLYISAFDRMLKERKRKGLNQVWETAEDVFRWWIGDQTIPGQMELEFEETD